MQIQRIQTLWLILALGCLIAFLVLPFGHLAGIDINGVNVAVDLVSYEFLGVIIPLGLAIILTVIGIFSYKNLGYQRSMVALSLMMTAVTAGVSIYLLCDRSTLGTITWSWTTAFLCGALLLEILAICGISRDAKLLRSINRLR